MSYNELLKQLKGTGKLWEDPHFPANSNSLYYSKANYKVHTWKRAKEINQNAILDSKRSYSPEFRPTIRTNFERSRFFSALVMLYQNKEHFENVMPDGQDFGLNYIGAFKFQFWIFGQWREVIVDDRLPMLNNELDFVFSKVDSEFWAPLLVKAYAKMYGTYEGLLKVSQKEALQDFTGGICETFYISPTNYPDFHNLHRSFTKSSIFDCIIKKPELSVDADCQGQQPFQSHSITDMQWFPLIEGGTEKVFRIFNPNILKKEFSPSTWYDNSDNWKLIDEEYQNKYKLLAPDGETWIAYYIFIRIFTHLVVCHLVQNNPVNNINESTYWNITQHKGSWVRNCNSGGSRNNLESYAMNSQYRVNVMKPDYEVEDGNIRLIVTLEQIDRRKLNLDFYSIGYDIYELYDDKPGTFDKQFFERNNPYFSTTDLNGMKRLISSSHILSVGLYLIVPWTAEINQDGKYILRFASEKQDSMLIDEKNAVVYIPKETQIEDITFDDLDTKLVGIFQKISGDRWWIDAEILEKILNAVVAKDSQCLKMKNFQKFNLSDCKSMIALFDINFSGGMEFKEFASLFKNLRIWKTVYKTFDEDCNGFLAASEYRKALLDCGYTVSNSLFKVFITRYADPQNGHISFQHFVISLVRLAKNFELLENLAQKEDLRQNSNPYYYLPDMVYQ